MSLHGNGSDYQRATEPCEPVRAAPGSAGVGRTTRTQGQPEISKQIHGAANLMIPAMEKALPVKALDDQGQQDQQPNDEDAVGLVMTEVLHAVAGLAIVEALVFDLPAALSHMVETQAAQFAEGEIGQPLGLNNRAIVFVLAVAQHAHRGPIEGFPRIKIIGIPNLDSVVPLLEYGAWGGWLSKRARTSADSWGRFSLTRATTGKSKSSVVCRKGAVAYAPSPTT